MEFKLGKEETEYMRGQKERVKMLRINESNIPMGHGTGGSRFKER